MFPNGPFVKRNGFQKFMHTLQPTALVQETWLQSTLLPQGGALLSMSG